MATTGDRGPAEQQGDGQPENLEELRDPTGGSAMTDRGKDAPATDRAASSERTSPSRGGSQADGDEVETTD
jgi:hypothetical protein